MGSRRYIAFGFDPGALKLLLFFVRVNQVLVRLWTRAMPLGRKPGSVSRGLIVRLTGCFIFRGELQQSGYEGSEALRRFCRFYWRASVGGMDENLLCAESVEEL
jgi:hypothetical protein